MWRMKLKRRQCSMSDGARCVLPRVYASLCGGDVGYSFP